MRVKYNVDTHLIFQIGDPVDHATAPFLHNAMYDLANVNAICTPVFVPRGHLPEFIQAVKTIGASGFDITMPHKSDIIPLLDECDEASRVFNCVNHVKLVDGKLIGIGLDGVGMGLGYTLTATLMASIREILGSGTWLGFKVLPDSMAKIGIMTQAPGAFFCFGLLMAGCVWLEGKLDARIERKSCCDLDNLKKEAE